VILLFLASSLLYIVLWGEAMRRDGSSGYRLLALIAALTAISLGVLCLNRMFHLYSPILQQQF
jgi:hypothetical protein